MLYARPIAWSYVLQSVPCYIVIVGQGCMTRALACRWDAGPALTVTSQVGKRRTLV